MENEHCGKPENLKRRNEGQLGLRLPSIVLLSSILVLLWVIVSPVRVGAIFTSSVSSFVDPSPTPTGPLDNIQTVTALPDGSIVHIVQAGQSLWSLAIAYNVKVADIQSLNNMGSSELVRPGDRLIIVPGFTSTPSPTETNTPIPPTLTPTPTRTMRPVTLTPSVDLATETPKSTATVESRFSIPAVDGRRALGVGLIVICGLGLLFILFGAIKRN